MSEDYITKTTENVHSTTVSDPQTQSGVKIGPLIEYEEECGIWRYCYEVGSAVIEQCDGCGAYRSRSMEQIELHIDD